MLKKLKVKDFAIIENVEVDFSLGMTVLTGETGAGKSLIIDTISLLLGSRADALMVRYQAPKAIIEGVFQEVNPELDSLLEANSIAVLKEITIIREINSSGKNTIKVNGTTINLNLLKKISQMLGDIHIQNDTNKLFNPESYLSFIDPTNDNKFNTILNNYVVSLVAYNKAISNYEYIVNGKKQSLERKEFLEFEYNELTNLSLEPNLDIELEEKVNKLKNYDKIFSSLKEAYNNLESEYFSLDNIYNASKELSKIESYDKEYNELSSSILDSYYILDEAKEKISKNLSNLEYDESELDMAISRLTEIEKAKDKYKMTLDELITYKDKIKLEIDMVEDYDNLLNESKKSVISYFNILKDKATLLTNYRKKLSIDISKGITEECKSLDLEDTNFTITFNDVNYEDPFNKQIFTNNGVDIVSFMVSFNKGEPALPLHNVASGGEMSRMMLAFKSFYSRTTKQDLMVFDEIDTGVSGKTAKKIALKMKEISKNIQVLCITHLPQVASIGNNHKHIYKVEENNRTKTMVKDLTKQERIEEIAMMLSGDKLSPYALEHAESLLNESSE